MKIFKRAISLCLAAALGFGAFAVPSFAAEAKYPEPSGSDPAAWYLYGDMNRDGKVNSTDARKILRSAAYLDAQPASDSITYGEADYDRDGMISSRDARLVLRTAAKLDAPAEQPAHPYASKTSVSAADAFARMQTLNAILKPSDPTAREEYKYRARQSCSVDIKMTDALKVMLDDKTEKELYDEAAQTEKDNTFDTGYSTVPSVGNSYYSNLQLKGNRNTVFGNLDTNTVKNTVFSYNNADCTYKIRINFKNSTVTANADSPLRQVITDIPASAELKEAAGVSESDGIEIHLEAKIDKVNYTLKDDIKNAYVEYTFNAVTNMPISAEYGFESTLYVPATLIKVGIVEASFVMITNQNLKMNYTFGF